MSTLIKLDGTKEKVEPKNGKTFSLEELQGFVNGYIQILPINSGEYENMLMIIDEEAKLKVGAEINFEASQIVNVPIAGTVLIIEKSQIE